MNKSTEEIVSMFLGLVIVVVAVGLIFTFFQRKRGVVSVPGVSQTVSQKLEAPTGTKNETMIDGSTYIVKKGDSLWKIAEANYGSGYNWVDISKANKLTAPGQLAAGQKLILPKVEKKVVAEIKKSVVISQTKIETGTYKVVRGDNLWKIAVRTYGDGYQWVQIWKSNRAKMYSPNKLEIGMELVLPKLQ
jgi:nucleoid-associated protein YgaU